MGTKSGQEWGFASSFPEVQAYPYQIPIIGIADFNIVDRITVKNYQRGVFLRLHPFGKVLNKIKCYFSSDTFNP